MDFVKWTTKFDQRAEGTDDDTKTKEAPFTFTVQPYWCMLCGHQWTPVKIWYRGES